MSLFHCPPSFPFSLQHTDYSFTVNFEIPEEDEPSNPPNDHSLAVIAELRIRQRYILVLEPIKGQRVTVEDDCVVSPEFTFQFKIPLRLLATGPAVSRMRDRFVLKQLASLPISAGMAESLKPHIQNYAVLRAQETGNRKRLKMVFSVMALKIDLADEKECDKIRAGGWSSLRKLKS